MEPKLTTRSPSLLNKDSVLALKQLESGANEDIPPSNQRAAAGGSGNANLWQQSPTPASSANNGALYAESAKAAGKRPYQGGDDTNSDDDDNDEFETDNRFLNSLRLAQTTKRKQPSPKRVRIAPVEMPPPMRPRVPPPLSSAPATIAGPSSSAPRHSAPPSTVPDLQQLTQLSRSMTIAARKSKEPQQRRAWTRDDTRLLIRAVDVYNCKWSTIEKLIKEGTIRFEVQRDQQALRDKARLVKVDYLK